MKQEEILSILKELKNKYRKQGITISGLFGSFAWGSQTDTSDIDVAISLDNDYLEKNDVWNYFNTIEEIKKDIYVATGRLSDIYDLGSKNNSTQELLKEMIDV